MLWLILRWFCLIIFCVYVLLLFSFFVDDKLKDSESKLNSDILFEVFFKVIVKVL